MPDDATIVEGDAGFLGMASRLNPVQLPPGLCQLVENMRLDRGVAQTRKGAKRVAQDISEGGELTLDFLLGTDKQISSLTRVNDTATAVLPAHGYQIGDRVNIRGAVQSEYNNDFTILAKTNDSFSFTVTGNPTTPATGSLIANKGPVVRSNYSQGIIGSGVYSSPRLDNSNEYIVLCGISGAYLWREGASLLSISYPAEDTFEVGDDISVVQAFDKLYLLRTRPSDAVVRVDSIAHSGGIATVTILGGHQYQANEIVRITGAEQAGYLADFEVLGGANAPTSTTFKIQVLPETLTPASGALFAQRKLPALVWDGSVTGNFERVGQSTHPLGVTYSQLRSTSIGAFINNQMVIALNRDEVLVSDVFDAETFDPVFKSFRANAGSNDYIVAIHPYAEGQVLVFCRKSIWLATIAIDEDGVSIDPAASNLQLLTNEIGCSAKRTIATAGIYVFFLSDSGVYRLDNQFDLKLRGNTQPLSDPVADVFAAINQDKAHLSNAVYFNNRYYIAIPKGDTELPNTVLTYNMLNQQWESLDSYSFAVDQLLISDFGPQRRLFSANRNGQLYLLDEYEAGADDMQSGLGSIPVQGTLLTRRYGWGTLNAKRLLRSKASVVLPPGASCTLDAVTTDYDADFQVAALANSTAEQEDYTLKSPLRTKATYLDLRFRTTAGRPILRSITAEATRSNFEPTETRTLN